MFYYLLCVTVFVFILNYIIRKGQTAKNLIWSEGFVRVVERCESPAAKQYKISVRKVIKPK
jgi:hypothetical protein